MNLTIKIVTDDEVFKLLNNNQFLAAWNNLAIEDNKVTVIQEPPFVLTWYFQYSGDYKPILVLGYDESNQLVGLMPLALSLKDGHLTHAGDWQAEYHGWISQKDVDQDFPIQALIEIKKNFSPKIWHWRWMPPRAQNEWFFSPLLAKNNIYVKFLKRNSPIINLKNENRLKKIRKNKTIKNQLNQIKKTGGFYIERITDKEELKKLIDIVAIQCDFRHGAVHQTIPFENDKHKKSFYLERMNYPENNHFTVLWSNNNLLAFNYGACDSDTVYLGLTSYNPLESRNSPGNIFLLQLADFLVKEGYSYLDLTPGGDKYKERFCNEYQEVIMPTFYFGKIEKIKADLYELTRKIVKKCFLSVGINKEVMKDKITNVKVLFKRLPALTLSKVIKKIFSLIYEKHIYLQYKFSFDKFDLNVSTEASDINIQKYSDLLLYAGTNTGANPRLSRDELLLEALKRFSKGEVLYTIVKNGVLAHYGWMVKGGRIHRLMHVDVKFESPPNSVILYDFYTNPQFRGQGLYKKNLKKMLYDSFNARAKEVYIGVLSRNVPSKAAIEKVGFRLFRNFIKTRFLWIVKKVEK